MQSGNFISYHKKNQKDLAESEVTKWKEMPENRLLKVLIFMDGMEAEHLIRKDSNTKIIDESKN